MKDGWNDGWVDGWMGGWMDGWMWMDGWNDGRMDGWMDKIMGFVWGNMTHKKLKRTPISPIQRPQYCKAK